MTSTLASLPTIKKVAPKKGGLSFLRKFESAPAKASIATAKKLMKLTKASGQTVTGVMIGPDGSVSVTTAEAVKANIAPENPWDLELG